MGMGGRDRKELFLYKGPDILDAEPRQLADVVDRAEGAAERIGEAEQLDAPTGDAADLLEEAERVVDDLELRVGEAIDQFVVERLEGVEVEEVDLQPSVAFRT